MRLEPVEDWINAVAILHKKPSPIVAPDPSKGTSRCYLIEAVGEKAAAKGYKVGDIVVSLKVYDLLFYGGTFHRVTFQECEVMNRVRDVSLDEFVLLDGVTVATEATKAAA
jgi:hypothetical protein